MEYLFSTTLSTCKPDLTWLKAQGLGQKSDQFPIRLVVHRWCLESNLDTALIQTSQLGLLGPGLDPDPDLAALR